MPLIKRSLSVMLCVVVYLLVSFHINKIVPNATFSLCQLTGQRNREKINEQSCCCSIV